MTWVPTIMMGLAGGYMGLKGVPLDVGAVSLLTYVAGHIRGRLA